jgi:hypothetical protein
MSAKARITQARLRFALAALIATVAMLALAAPASATLGLTNWDGETLLENGEAATQAGSHPAIGSTTFSLTTTITPAEQELPTEALKDAIAELPPGLLGNPQAVARCPIVDLLPESNIDSCPSESQVGVVILDLGDWDVSEPVDPEVFKLYNLVPPPGIPALLGFRVLSVPTFVIPKLRSGGDYGLTLSSINTNHTLPYKDFTFEVWGVPAAPSHDKFRGACISVGAHTGGLFGPTGKECPSPDWPENAKAFISLPTSCLGPMRSDLTVRGWEGGEDSASFLSHRTLAEGGEPVGNTGCGALDFSPTLEARPTTNVADAPTGLKVDLHIPQEGIEDPEGTVEAHLKDTTVTLPEGLVINPSGANGLGACSSAQAGLLTPIGAKPIHLSDQGANCPDNSKVGSAEVDTPLVDHPVRGSLYIAAPNDNPFGSLLALYLAIDDPQTGTHATLPGEVHADPNTGQLTSTFTENPQLPVEDVKLDIPGGAYAPLKTPSTCGTYQTTSSLTPWSAPESGPPATPSDSYEISQGLGGGCPSQEAQMPNSPSFDAGTVEPLAGHYSPFVLNLRREDGSQRFAAIGLQPPKGLLAKLAGTSRCSEAALAQAASKPGDDERANPSCPASSHVGTVIAGAGAGPAPYYAQGEAYLAGPYKGAPISLAIITPASAGPFDLGTIVTRTALHLDPETAQIDAVSDPIPAILEGIPLNIRTVQVRLDRPGFTLNPTSCDPSEVKGQAISTLGQVASLASRFQLAECTRLPFKPKIAFSLKGGTKRGDHPALTAILKARPGDANLASISVALPRSEFLDQGHIGTVCTRVQWAADACPAASVYGTVSVKTPLLDQPLSGNVYLRSSDNLLPDLVPDLRGPADLPVRFSAAGRTDSIHGGIRNTFDFVPDAPFTKLVVKLKGAKKGLLVNSRDVCAKTYRATVKYGAHNGLALTEHPPLKASCKGKAKKKKHRAAKRAAR